jgi:predicted  nucleic acid-binding Zn-ribbon protein
MDHHLQKQSRQEKNIGQQPQQTQRKALGEEMKAWLESRPELMRRLEEMKRICQNTQGEHALLSQAESGLVEQLDATGRELIGAWLEQRNEQEQLRASSVKSPRKLTKKNCASRRSLAPCRCKSK